MGGQAAELRSELPEGITPEQIQKLIDEQIALGATSCVVQEQGGKKSLVTVFPPPRVN